MDKVFCVLFDKARTYPGTRYVFHYHMCTLRNKVSEHNFIVFQLFSWNRVLNSMCKETKGSTSSLCWENVQLHFCPNNIKGIPSGNFFLPFFNGTYAQGTPQLLQVEWTQEKTVSKGQSFTHVSSGTCWNFWLSLSTQGTIRNWIELNYLCSSTQSGRGNIGSGNDK